VLWTGIAAGGQRIVPDGAMDLIWVGDHILIAGPDSRAHLSSLAAGTALTGLRFAPGTLPAILALPASELRDLRVRLDEVWGRREAQRLADRIAGAPHPGSALEAASAECLRAAGPPAPIVGAIVTRVRAGQPIAAVAAEVGLSERQLHRRSLAAFGYGPKVLARVLRMGQALALARAGVPFADTAARAGYADQAHLARDVRALAGTSLGILVA
jgi:AraC-like DNA-binding protein